MLVPLACPNPDDVGEAREDILSADEVPLQIRDGGKIECLAEETLQSELPTKLIARITTNPTTYTSDSSGTSDMVQKLENALREALVGGNADFRERLHGLSSNG